MATFDSGAVDPQRAQLWLLETERPGPADPVSVAGPSYASDGGRLADATQNLGG